MAMKTYLTITCLLLSGCAGIFDPDLSSNETTASASTTASTTNSTTNPNSDSDHGSSSGEDPSMSSDESSSEDSSGSEESSEGSSGSVPEGCGNDIVEGDEECDGIALAGNTCGSLLDGGSGDLGCFADCTYDVSACSLGGPQPEEGQWSECMDYPECEDGSSTIWHCENNLCSFDCETVEDCGPSPGGTAVSECRDLGNGLNRCYLSCADGKTCPDGMACAGDYCHSIFE